MEINQAVRETREVTGLSQQKFAERIGGKGIATIQRWESGESKPTPDSLVSLYRLANEVVRPDLAAVFLRGGYGGPEARLPNAASRLGEACDYISVVNSRLMRLIADERLTEADEKRLLGEAVSSAMDCQELLQKIMAEIL